MSEQLSRVGNWVSIATNIGVLVGLAILIYEINQNTIALENETDVAIYSNATNSGLLVAESSDLAELLARAEVGPWEALTLAERLRIDGLRGAYLDNVELQFRLFRRRGESPDNIVFGEGLFGVPAFRTYWSEVKHLYSDDFVSYFDALIQMTPNNSLQRTYLPVTSFAYAKEPPATVGR